MHGDVEHVKIGASTRLIRIALFDMRDVSGNEKLSCRISDATVYVAAQPCR